MDWIVIVGWFTKLVLLLLLLLSVWSVTIIIDRRRAFHKGDDAHLDTKLRQLLLSGDLAELAKISSGEGLRSQAMRLYLTSTSAEQIEHLSRAFILESRNSLDKGLTTLGTL